MAENESKSSKATSAKSEETKTAKASEEKAPEQLLSSVRSASAEPMGASGNQLPGVITGFRENGPVPAPKLTVTPISPLDGGDGSHTTPQQKEDDYVWKPFVAPPSWPTVKDFNTDGTIWFDTPATRTQNTTNDTAVVAGNSLTKY